MPIVTKPLESQNSCVSPNSGIEIHPTETDMELDTDRPAPQEAVFDQDVSVLTLEASETAFDIHPTTGFKSPADVDFLGYHAQASPKVNCS
jgi:hypothetical protein